MLKYYCLYGLLLVYSCEATAPTTTPPSTPPNVVVQPVDPATASLTPHFVSWLNANDYADDDFVRPDLPGHSYGGKTDNSTPVTQQPVIFIHGNSDKAVGNQDRQMGWTTSLDYFLEQGHTTAELYAITWGQADAQQATATDHDRQYVMRVRRFIQAVLDYTGAERVDVVSHSMGVTLARRAIKGGEAFDPDDGGVYTVGEPLTDRVDTFVGIAGGNLGLTNCFLASGLPTCNPVTGFYPGRLGNTMQVEGMSRYLAELNDGAGFEGQYRYSLWSTVDQLIGYGCIVYGRNTCQLPSQTGEKSYDAAPYDHFMLKDKTAAVQYSMVVNHRTE